MFYCLAAEKTVAQRKREFFGIFRDSDNVWYRVFAVNPELELTNL